MFCIRSRKLITSWENQGLQIFSGWNITQNDFFKYKMFKECFYDDIFWENQGLLIFRNRFLNLFEYSVGHESIKSWLYVEKIKISSDNSPLNKFWNHIMKQADHILIKSANHTFFPIAWIWGHVVNTCLLHFQVCGWSSGRKTHFETFSR